MRKAYLFFRKGTGTMLLGSFMCVICAVFFLYFWNMFLLNNSAVNMQNALDSIADGTAYAMAKDTGEYEDAVDEAQRVRGIVTDALGADLGPVAVSREAFEKSTIDLTVRGMLYPAAAGISVVRRSATTFGACEYVQWMMRVAENDHIGYSQADRYSLFSAADLNENTSMQVNCDCSSLVSMAMMKAGIFDRSGASICTTATLPNALLSAGARDVTSETEGGTDLSRMRKGDILIWDGAGNLGHAKVYAGNGLQVEAAGDDIGVIVTSYYIDGHDWHVYRL